MGNGPSEEQKFTKEYDRYLKGRSPQEIEREQQYWKQFEEEFERSEKSRKYWENRGKKQSAKSRKK